MKLRLERFAFIAMAVVVVACGGGGVSADQACTDVAQARCGQLQMCSAFLFQRRWPDLATCEVREKLACTNGLAAPKTAQSPSHVDSCATALDQEACTAVLSDTQQPASCEPPAGTGAIGAACGLVGTTNSFCTGGAICVVATGMTSGTCVAPVAEGAACDTVVGPFCEVPAKCVTNGSGTAGTCGLEGTTTCS